VDVRLALVPFPTHPCLRIDPYDGGGVDLAVSEYLPSDLELTPKARVLFEHSFLSTDGQAAGDAWQ
jgi:hypothetical protein